MSKDLVKAQQPLLCNGNQAYVINDLLFEVGDV